MQISQSLPSLFPFLSPGRVGSPKPLTFRRQRGANAVSRGGGAGSSTSGGSGAARSPRRVNPHAVTDDEGRPLAVLVDELNSVGFAEEMEPQQIFLPNGMRVHGPVCHRCCLKFLVFSFSCLLNFL